MTKEEKIQTILEISRKYLGRPYRKRASYYQAPDVFNCSTFTRFVFDHAKILLPAKAITQAAKGEKVNPRNLEPGDLVFVRGVAGYYNPIFPDGIGHVVIYLGHERVISAKGKDKKVVEESVNQYLMKEQFRVARRFVQ